MPNIMKDVAVLLGVDMRELFKLNTNGGVHNSTYILRENGLFSILDGKELPARYWSIFIITGEAEIIKLPWRPKRGETY